MPEKKSLNLRFFEIISTSAEKLYDDNDGKKEENQRINKCQFSVLLSTLFGVFKHANRKSILPLGLFTALRELHSYTL